MNPKRWQQIESLYQAARDLEPSERNVLLDEACVGDEELRREVESLLHQTNDDNFRTAAAMQFAAQALAQDSGPSFIGQEIGSYKILSLLGVGGMGEVYRAKDLRLGREVAIKVLPASVANAPDRRRRFEREARLLAVFNHPHIGAIYGVEQFNGTTALVLEMVEGPTLAERLASGPLPLAEALKVALHIAEALKAAHDKGIVHRDLKPANVKITPEGIVKVLDFGLAKALAGDTESADLSQTLIGTEEGVILGTPSHMSPEQARGQAVDKRTDIWAFGCVLYEMLAQRPAFTGSTVSDTIAAILTRDPDWGALPKTTPGNIHRLLRRCLEKDFKQRLQDIAIARDDLGASAPAVTVGRVLSGRSQRRARWTIAAIVVAAVVGWGLVRTRDSAVRLEYTRLTNFPDSVHSPTLSKDGKMLAFVRGPVSFLGGPGDVYLKVLPEGQPVALTNDGDVKLAPVFSPDDSRVVYTAANNNWSSMSVPISGGSPVVMMPNAAGLRWVGAGQVLFSEIMSGAHMGLVTATESRGSPRPVYFPESTFGMVHFSELSPDGKWVLAVEMLAAVWQPCRLVPFDGSSPGRQVGPAGALCTAAAWSPDGQWMYLAAETNGESHLWRQRFPDGQPEQLTSGLNQEWGVALDPDGRSIITSVGNSQSTVWYHDEKGNRQLSLEGYAYRPLVSPDGKNVFYLVRKGVQGAIWTGEIWSADLTSGRNERLLPEFLVQYFDVSRDAKTIVFEAVDPSGKSTVWIAPVDRSQAPRRLTPDAESGDQHPLLSTTGDIYFVRIAEGLRVLYRMTADGSNRRKVIAVPGYFVNISPDEKWAAFWNNDTGVLLYPLARGPAHPLCSCSAGPIFQDSPRVSWSGDGKRLVINAGGSMSNLGTNVLPWKGADALPSAGLLTGADMRRLPGAIQLRETSVASGYDGAAYAFAQTSQQTNLYRIRFR